MPKFTFVCEQCQHSEQKFTSISKKTVKCSICGADANQQLPKLANSEVRETVNSYTGKKWRQDQKEMLDERRDEYYWTVEVPRLVQKYSLETCLEQGWVWIDDDGKLNVHTKPPHRR